MADRAWKTLERTGGDGSLHAGVDRLDVHYHIRVSQEQLNAGGEWLDGLTDIEAVVRPISGDPYDLATFIGADNVTLCLDDGRRFDCYVLDVDGRLSQRSNGTIGLYGP